MISSKSLRHPRQHAKTGIEHQSARPPYLLVGEVKHTSCAETLCVCVCVCVAPVEDSESIPHPCTSLGDP